MSGAIGDRGLVEYSLTPRGTEVVALLLPLFTWILDHAADIVG